MRTPQWYDVLEPRTAVVAGVVGLTIVWSLTFYAFQAGYVFWGYSPEQWKSMGTAIDVLGFVIPYLLVKCFLKQPRR
jgi:hypothetical protein